MARSLSRWQLAGFLFTAVFGTFLHFLFDLTGENLVAGLFSAVNESIWEHLKLIYWPMFLYAMAQYRFGGKELSGFWWVKLAGILFGLGLIPVLYYTYSGIWGKSVDWLNITIFFLAAGAAYYWETVLFRRKESCRSAPGIALGVMILIGLIFILLTFFPPQIPLFRDPVTAGYGL